MGQAAQEGREGNQRTMQGDWVTGLHRPGIRTPHAIVGSRVARLGCGALHAERAASEQEAGFRAASGSLTKFVRIYKVLKRYATMIVMRTCCLSMYQGRRNAAKCDASPASVAQRLSGDEPTAEKCQTGPGPCHRSA